MTYRYHFLGDSKEVWKIQWSHLYEMTDQEKIDVEAYLEKETERGAYKYNPMFCGPNVSVNLRLWFYFKKYSHMPTMKRKPNVLDWLGWWCEGSPRC